MGLLVVIKPSEIDGLFLDLHDSPDTDAVNVWGDQLPSYTMMVPDSTTSKNLGEKPIPSSG
jgi:hypothetical protein